MLTDSAMLILIAKRLGIIGEVNVDDNNNNDPVNFPNQVNFLQQKVNELEIQNIAMASQLDAIQATLEDIPKTIDFPEWSTFSEDMVSSVITWLTDNLKLLMQALFDTESEDPDVQDFHIIMSNWIAVKMILPAFNPLFIRYIIDNYRDDLFDLIVPYLNEIFTMWRNL